NRFSLIGKVIQHATFDRACPQNVHTAYRTSVRAARRDGKLATGRANGYWQCVRGSAKHECLFARQRNFSVFEQNQPGLPFGARPTTWAIAPGYIGRTSRCRLEALVAPPGMGMTCEAH